MRYWDIIQKAFSTLVQSIIRFVATYPVIKTQEDLYAYYRKHNVSGAYSMIFFSLCCFTIQCIRIFIFMFESSSREALYTILSYFGVVDTFLLTGIFTSLYMLPRLLSKNEERNISYQIIISRVLKIFGAFLIIAEVITCKAVLNEENAKLLVKAHWMVIFLCQVQLLTQVTDGLIYQFIMQAIYNFVVIPMGNSQAYLSFKIIEREIITLLFAFAIFVSIDKHKKTTFMLEKTQKEQKKIYEQFMKKMQNPVIILDKDSVIISNECSREKLGITPENFGHKASFIVSSKGETLYKYVDSIFKSKGPVTDMVKNEKFYMHNEDSDYITCNAIFQVTIICSTYFSRSQTVSILLRDVTEELMHEQKSIEDKYKNILLYSLSHELRTSLNILHDFLSYIKGYLTENDPIDKLAIAKGAWRYLRNQISDIFDYVQILTEDFKIHSKQFVIRRLVESMRKLTFNLLEKKRSSIKLVFNVDDKIPKVIDGDRERLEQILFNLLSNAVKFTSAGIISLNVSVAKTNHGSIYFSVSDTGIGMSADTVNSLFKIKENSNIVQTEATGHGLCGLGLTVSRMICNRMGGDIDVTSVIGKGSTFKFGIALKVHKETFAELEDVPNEEAKIRNVRAGQKALISRGSLESSSLNEINPKPIPSPNLSPNKRSSVGVLVVDDNDLNRLVARRMVMKYDLHVEDAENGKEAIDKLISMQNSKTFSTILILMDINMPVMDGITATIEIRKISQVPHLFIVALTAFASEIERLKCLESGMDDFVSKPLTKESISGILTKILLI